jgi:hypothetical protein
MTAMGIRIFLILLFQLLVGIAMVGDIRKRTFPVWVGWALYAVALAYLLGAGLWVRGFVLLGALAAYRLRNGTIWVDAIFAVVLLIAGWREGAWFILPTLGLYALFCLGWLGTCDAEIAFPLIALLGGEVITLYLVGFWILVPPAVVYWTRGMRGGLARFSQVAARMLQRGESPLEDAEALRLPWAISPFLALTLYNFIFPAQILNWWRQLFP